MILVIIAAAYVVISLILYALFCAASKSDEYTEYHYKKDFEKNENK